MHVADNRLRRKIWRRRGGGEAEGERRDGELEGHDLVFWPARRRGQPPRVYRRSAAVGLNRGPGEGLPRVRRSRPLVRSGLLSSSAPSPARAAARALIYVCGFAVLVLSAPARAILSRSGLGAAYGPREESLRYFLTT